MSESIWTGEINRTAAIDADVGFYDTTLRDGEQTVGVVLDPEQKLEIARLLDELGVERIEAGFPRVSPEDERAFKLVLDAGLRAGLTRDAPRLGAVAGLTVGVADLYRHRGKRH
jgi:isopropylmalate/homocitrate/citramalate synthase